MKRKAVSTVEHNQLHAETPIMSWHISYRIAGILISNASGGRKSSAAVILVMVVLRGGKGWGGKGGKGGSNPYSP